MPGRIKHFGPDAVELLQAAQSVRVRSGSGRHRFIGIWMVVVEGRLFVRSWSLKQRSWYRTFLSDPRGAIVVATKRFAVRAIRTRSERIKKAVDKAYLSKYRSGGLRRYGRDLVGTRSRNTTTELVPLR